MCLLRDGGDWFLEVFAWHMTSQISLWPLLGKHKAQTHELLVVGDPLKF